jgi:biotin operon repressor
MQELPDVVDQEFGFFEGCEVGGPVEVVPGFDQLTQVGAGDPCAQPSPGSGQKRREWSAVHIAGELGVTERTVRRDVTRLRDLGYPIATIHGAGGGLPGSAPMNVSTPQQGRGYRRHSGRERVAHRGHLADR